MQFQDLQKILTITDGKLVVTPGLLTPNIDAVIADVYRGHSLQIDEAEPGTGQASDTVTIRGRSSFLNALNLPLTATFTLDGAGAVQMMVEYTLLGDRPGPNDWKFSHSFPSMPKVVDWRRTFENPLAFALDDLPFFDASFVVVSDERRHPVSDVDLEPGINFVSSLRPQGAVGIIESLFGGKSPITVHGTIVIPTDTSTIPPIPTFQFPWTTAGLRPGILLRADLGLDRSFGTLTLGNVGLQLYSPHDEQWLSANPGWEPAFAYTGALAVPSASLRLDVTAPIAIGDTSSLLMIGNFQGVSVGNLARLVDLAGSDDLSTNLPDQIQSAGDALAKLQLTNVSVEVEFDVAQSVFSLADVSFTIGMPDLRWKVWDDHFEIDSLACRFRITRPFDAARRRLTVDVLGAMQIEGVPVAVGASSQDGFTVYAALGAQQTIPLDQLVSTYVPGVPAPSALTIDVLRASVAPFKSYGMVMSMANQPNPWTIPLGPKELVISDVTLLFAYPKGGPVAGAFGGTVGIDGIGDLSLRYAIPGDVVLRSRVPHSSLMTVVRSLSNQTVALPDDFDIHFDNSSVLIQKAGANYVFQLATEIENVGSLALQIQRSGGQWGFAAGLAMSPRALLTQIRGLAGVHDLIALFALDKLLVVVSSVDPSGITFPDMAAFADPSIRGGTITLPARAPNAGTGLTVYAQWAINESHPQQKLLKQLLKLDSASLDIILSIGPTPSKNAELLARVSTRVAGLALDASFGGRFGPSGPGLFLGGTLTVPINSCDYTFSVELLFVAEGGYISGTMMSVTTLDFGPFKLGNVALAVGVNWSGIPSLGIAGTLDVGQVDSSLAIFFNANQPSQSLVAGAISNVSLKTILDTLTGSAASSPVDDLLDQFALYGLEPFYIPASVADDLDNLRISSVSAAFAQKNVTIPTASANVLLVVNTPGSIWYLTDLTDRMRHYQLHRDAQGIKVTFEPQFYFAPQATFIGQLPFQQGFRINGGLKVLTLDASAQVDVNVDRGIAVDASMSRIVIGTESLFSISAVQSPGGPPAGHDGPRVSISTYQRDSDPIAEFRPPHFYINGALNLLGLQKHVFASLSKDGFAFDLNGDLVPACNFGGHCRIKSLTDMEVGASVRIAIGKIDLGPLGSISINTGVAGALDISVKGTLIRAQVAASFTFAGSTFRLDPLPLEIDTQSLLNLAEWAWAQVKAALVSFLRDAERWAKAVADGFIAGVKDVAKVLQDYFNKTLEEAQNILRRIQEACASTNALLAM